MSKIRVGQKPARVFKFLMGVRHPKAAQAMKLFGFSDEHLRDGWDRLEAATDTATIGQPAVGANPKLVTRLDEFENVWFAVTKATLKANFPAIHDAFFVNLSQGSGRDVARTLGMFLTRLRELEAENGAFAERAPEARALLAERGLSAAVVAEGEALINEVKTTIKVEGVDPKANKEARVAAINDLWDWYLEWSAIARVAVKDRSVLRGMGFLAGASGSKSAGVEPEAELDDADEAAKNDPEGSQGEGGAIAAE